MDRDRTPPGGRNDPLIGRTLDGRYEIDELIARGGMASVYRAMDLRLQRRVAVKVMHASLADDAAFVARFDREARSAAAIDHPGVVSVTDQGNDGGLIFLVMEYVQGRTLRQVLTERRRIAPIDTLRVMEPMLDALGAAHAAGFVHRDIKPENIILADDGRVKITDFGLARAVESTPLTTDAGLLLGTVAYLAPEQVSRGIADSRSDVYACGVLLFELLTGETPHTAGTPLAVAYKHVNDDVPLPSTLVPGVPPALDDVVQAATSRDPDARPSDGHEMLAMLRRARPSILMSGGGGETSVLDMRDAPTTLTRLPARGSGPAPAAAQEDYDYEPGFFANLWWRHRRGVIAWLVVLVALGLVAGGGWYLGSGRYASAPDLLKLSAAQAEAVAARHHLKVVTSPTEVYSEDVPAGQVAAQKPGSGKHIKHDGTITITISKGQLRFSVPSVVGKTLDDARNALIAEHLTPGSTSSQYSATVPQGRVISSDPAAGARLKENTAVDLVLSNGPPPVPVPNVVGQTLADAQTALHDAGLAYTVVHAYSDTVALGAIISQDPSSGTVPKGSTITLTESDGPEMVAVPDLTNDTQQEAIDALAALGLKASIVQIPGRRDRVVSQNPEPGTLVHAGSTITVYVTTPS